MIADSLIPAHQLSTDDFAGTLENQTNLAIKGIIGIKAMSVIAETLGDDSRSNNYSVRYRFLIFSHMGLIVLEVYRLIICRTMAGSCHIIRQDPFNTQCTSSFVWPFEVLADFDLVR